MKCVNSWFNFTMQSRIIFNVNGLCDLFFVGESVHVCNVQLQREEVRTTGASPAGWVHCGL